MASDPSRTFSVVGPGRAGRSFIAALTAIGWELVDVYGRSDEKSEAADRAEIVLLTVPDDVISSVARSIAPGRAVVLHVSGAKGLGSLSPHERVGSIHPLMSLPDETIGAARLASGAVFAVAGDAAATELVSALGGRPIEVGDGARPLYHATAAVAANHLVALCAQVERLADLVGVPVEVYWELMDTTLANVRQTGAISSLTGPAARGDTSTLAAHIGSLPEDERALYVTLARHAAAIAGHDPGITVTEVGGLVSVSTIAELRSILDEHRRTGGTVGFVPTMGYLHDGHASLMRASAAENDMTVASIFVNPLQFGPTEDLDAYPRDLASDTQLAVSAGVGVVFAPAAEEMYPAGPVLTTVSVSELSARWDGASRPTHFAGVATVVSKLFNIVGPCRAYFGEKDFQQLAIIRRMASDLSVPVDVVGCAIVREPDGLAMSSRNVYLDEADRAAAIVLRRALDAGVAAVEDGERDPAKVDAVMAGVVGAEPRAELDYAAAVDPATLMQPNELGRSTRLLIAARVGKTRLIDNCGVEVDMTATEPKGVP